MLWYVLHSKYLSELNCSSDISYHYYSIVIYYSIHHLQDLVLVFKNHENFRDFENCNISLFHNLGILKFPTTRPKHEYLIKFLENNGKNLEKFIFNILKIY